MKTICILLAIAFGCAAAPFTASFQPSPSDVYGTGSYYLTAIASNAPATTGGVLLGSSAAGVTNIVFDTTNLPSPQSFIYVSFSDGTNTSAPSTPWYFTAPAPVAPLPPPRIIGVVHHG